jgi:hypothetical protein
MAVELVGVAVLEMAAAGPVVAVDPDQVDQFVAAGLAGLEVPVERPSGLAVAYLPCYEALVALDWEGRQFAGSEDLVAVGLGVHAVAGPVEPVAERLAAAVVGVELVAPAVAEGQAAAPSCAVEPDYAAPAVG